ncbi:hypothetical protein AJ78_00110 [Emergomyces pasteurianus Ep9510]|uniref:Uncharacterized protein n=1 Tax=Emergomyces pasteurianus Ep9510 TaxID=1447872 RepID=A0A1J9QVM9_9EURO|nr:hypothetical protein AJ78_00110 [Emergomyces pasteurianus Ep9510]
MKRLLVRLPLRQCSRAQCGQKFLYSKLYKRFNSSVGEAASKPPLRSSTKSSGQILRPPARTVAGKFTKNESTKLEEVLIYHAGTGKIAFIGMMRITTLLIFSVSCLVVAPAFYYSGDFHWYIAPAIAIGGSLPMLFVLYTTAPFVNLIYLTLPHAARQTRQRTQFYLKDVPRNAILNIETMKLNFYFRKTRVALSDLTPGRSTFRPINFINANPIPQPWWKGNNIYFYAPVKTRLSLKPTSKYFPEVWEGVFEKIKQNTSKGDR